MVKRVGNWYGIEMNNLVYNVLIQKDPKSVICEPSSILVFDETFNKVEDYSIWNDIERIMNEMDWKNDMVG